VFCAINPNIKCMETYEYCFEQLEDRDGLFSSELEHDGWVLYHATTSIAEGDIDQNGLNVRSSGFADEALRVIRVFRGMNWTGTRRGTEGYPVLRGISLYRGGSNELYFREQSTRSLSYAQRDFAGGETLRALHYALADLQEYLEKREVREDPSGMMVRGTRPQASANLLHFTGNDDQWD
jgi:hypothetical protein